MTTFRDLLNSGRKFIGTYMMYPDSMMIEVMKLAGYDFLIFDTEHEGLTFTDIMPLLRTSEACGMATMIRVPGLEEGSIKKALDMGASAIKVPGISSVKEAKAAVSYSKFAPEGIRGACPFVRGNGYGTNRFGCWEEQNKKTVVTILVEGIDGIKNLEEIIAIPGIDVISVGNFDLSLALGVPGQSNHPKVQQAALECARLCAKYGKSCSVQVISPSDAAQYRDAPGVSHFHTELPPTVIYQAFKNICDGIKESLK